MLTYKNSDQLFMEFMDTQFKLFQDTVDICDYKLFVDFKYENGRLMLINYVKIYKNNEIIFEGYVSRQSGKLNIFRKI